MPLRLDVKKKLSQRSDRVKCVDIHPTEPWVLSGLYSGHAIIWNVSLGTAVKSFEVTELPVRAAKFIPRKQLIAVGSDDMHIRAFNYNTTEKAAEMPEAHTDYIRYLEVHPDKPYVLSSSDDMQIKLWDWDKLVGGAWSCLQVFEGHAHYVMMVKFNPKDTNTFASASLDRSVKVWGLNSPTPNYSLDGHDRGVNCVDYYHGGDKPYLISGADDCTLKIWDYQTKSVVSTLEGHSNNVSAVAFHPRLPVIISGAEDGTVRIWNNSTHRLETTLNYGMERCWTLAVSQASNKVAIGYDEGTIMVKLGHEMPVASMDKNGKLILASNNVISTGTIRGMGAGSEDGARMPLVLKELGNVELYPQSVSHNANGRFVAVCGDNEYVIYTAQALRNKSFGTGLDFVWSPHGSGDYAVRESSTCIKIFKNFKEHLSFRPPFSAMGMFGGALLGVRSNDCVIFFDWDSGRVVRRIEECPKAVHWSDSGELCALACEDTFYVLKFDSDAMAAAALATGAEAAAIAEDGVEGAFDLLHEIPEKLRTGQWVGDCLVYVNSRNKLNYYVGGEVMTLGHLERRMYMLGYLAKEGRVYLLDKASHVASFSIPLSILEYQTAVVRRDFEAANAILPDIPEDQHNTIARFLESQGFKEEALAVARDPDVKFDLALQLNDLHKAFEIMRDLIDPSSPEASAKWKQLSDLALATANLPLAEECALRASDLGGLLLIYTSRGDAAGLTKLAGLAAAQGRSNVSFISHLLLGDVSACLDVLAESKRLPEAAFLARTYAPSQVPRLVEMWKADLATSNVRAADSLADPVSYPNLFPDLEWAVKAEDMVKARGDSRPPAASYLAAKEEAEADLIELAKAMALSQSAPAAPASPAPASPAPASPAAAGSPAAGAAAGGGSGDGSPAAASPVAAAAASPAAGASPAASPAAAAASSPPAVTDSAAVPSPTAVAAPAAPTSPPAAAATASPATTDDGVLVSEADAKPPAAGGDAGGDAGVTDSELAAVEEDLADLLGDEWAADES